MSIRKNWKEFTEKPGNIKIRIQWFGSMRVSLYEGLL